MTASLELALCIMLFEKPSFSQNKEYLVYERITQMNSKYSNTPNIRNILLPPSVLDTVESLPGEDGLLLLYAASKYGATGEIIKINPIIDAMMLLITPIIDSNTLNYAAKKAWGKRGGRPEKTPEEKIQAMKRQGKTQAEIAKELMISESTVRRKWNVYDNTDDDTDKANDNCYNSNIEREINNDKVKEIERDKDKDIEVMSGETLRLCKVMNGNNRKEQPRKSHPEIDDDDELPF